MIRRSAWLALPLLAACAAPPPHHPTPGGVAHWDYEGHDGPEHWDELDPAFAACETGQRQSPIAVQSASAQPSPGYAAGYAEHTPTLRNNGHTIQVDHPPGSWLEIGGERFELLQYHFHTPAEHVVDGVRHPMELHLVHRGAGGALAVLGVLLREGAHNPAYAPLLEGLPRRAGEEHTAATPLRAAALLPNGRSLAGYRYAGSLTTPPCSEGVDWHLLAEPVELSAEQIAAYRAVIPLNSRPVQPLHGRTVVRERP